MKWVLALLLVLRAQPRTELKREAGAARMDASVHESMGQGRRCPRNGKRGRTRTTPLCHQHGKAPVREAPGFIPSARRPASGKILECIAEGDHADSFPCFRPAFPGVACGRQDRAWALDAGSPPVSSSTQGKHMSTTSGLNASPTVETTQAGSHVWRDRIAPALLALALGVALIYGAGFASKVELHNAAHDGRHSAGFPCH
ncbi:hypothetical protein Hsero_2659 [Herbaspirillum seropedicae SmR1]|uniref:CbtB-domain containing protein n=2 Tax=Herbaspirillum seropedicae TaxID=964 RepID=D8IXQ3_HERSS|nr:hypothetical protein Hsero_2659 [Herbaspirillum seropedicae SmR1]